MERFGDLANEKKIMSKSLTLLWGVSFISALVLLDLMKTYEDTSRAIIDNILFIACILFVGGWILDKIWLIIIKFLPESKPVKIRKSKKRVKKEESSELTPLQFILGYPICTFSCMILIGLVTSGFQP